MKSNEKIMIFGLMTIAILLAGVLVSSGLISSSSNDNSLNSTDQELEGYSDLVIINVIVIDETSQEPIENAIVYLGANGGSGMEYTDNEGKTSLQLSVCGSYSLNVFKKGYNRFSKSFIFEAGELNITIELEKKPENPTSFSIEGTIIEVVTAEGSRSENHYFKLRINGTNEEEYIFNEIGVNSGFNSFVNTTVLITGFREIGFIGWQYESVEGIYIEEIKEI